MGSLAPIIRPIYFVHLNFSDDDVYVNTSPNDFEWNGQKWLGTGILGEITPPSQNIELSVDRISIRLTGVPVAKLADARSKNYRNRKAKLYVGLLDENWELIETPKETFSGRMDTMSTESSNATASILIDIVSDMSEWQRSRPYRYTDEMQRDRFSDDLGFQFVSRQKEAVLNWGS